MTRTDRYVRVCPTCIETIPSTAKTCKFCGANLEGVAKDAKPQPHLNVATGSLGAIGCAAAVGFALFLALVIFIAVLQLTARG